LACRNVHGVRYRHFGQRHIGIGGAALADWVLSLLGIALGGWLGYLIAGFIGASIIIFLWRVIRGRSA
jgi:uncharacterized membrane protein YeaQ/YmgE (transglycosylase-associated protein family)